MKTNYTSVPIIASVIGAQSRKAMYLVHPTSLNGDTVYRDTWIPIKWISSKPAMTHYIQWEHHSQELIQFNMAKATPSMIIDTNDIIRQLVGTKVQSYLELSNRFIIYLPTWMLSKRTVLQDGKEVQQDPIITPKYTKAKQEEQIEFNNDDDYYGVAEKTAMASHNQTYLQDRAESTFGMQFHIREDSQSLSDMSQSAIDYLKQWELDNPEYTSYE
jgi:hypothetical protein